MDTILQPPTHQLIKEYARKFQLQSGEVDQALRQLLAAFPGNNNLSDVLLKVATLNSFYATNIYDVYRVALHIQGLQIDNRLQEGDLTLVQHIALVEMANGKKRRNYSFATKYCSWHRPETFPIYDFYVDYLLWLYVQQDSFFGAARFHRNELWDDYSTFTRIVSAFRDYYSLQLVSLRQIDNFLWLYGKEVWSALNKPK